MEPFSWRCHYCGQNATITDENYSQDSRNFNMDNKYGNLRLATAIIVCPNPECREYEIRASLFKMRSVPAGSFLLEHGVSRGLVPDGDPLFTWKLKPQSDAIRFPDYVPKPIVDDYNEACLILNLSPKASATLSRRCLQGIIRDFWGIIKSRLIDEIDELNGKVEDKTWQAIDAVRKMGNIGAHMEKDINLVIDVETEEAELLKRLIEMLIKDWYMARHDREKHLDKIIEVAKKK